MTDRTKILTREERQLLYRKYKGECALCGRHVDFGEVNIDHRIPLAVGGPDSLENMQIAHKFCNNSKRDRTVAVNKLPDPHPIYSDKRYNVHRCVKEKALGIECDLRPVDIMIPVELKEILDYYCSQECQSKTEIICKFIATLESQLSDETRKRLEEAVHWRTYRF